MRTRMISIGAVAVLAIGTGIALPTTAQALVQEKRATGTVGGAQYEIEIERENGGFEVNVDLDNTPAGSKWKTVIMHEGKVISRATANAVPDDGRYEVDFNEVFAENTPGTETFVVKITRTNGTGTVSRTINWQV